MSEGDAIILENIHLSLVNNFPNNAGKISILDLSYPLLVERNSFFPGKLNIIPKIWICETGIYDNSPYKSDYLLIKQEQLLYYHCNINDFVKCGYAEEITLLQVKEIMINASKKGYLFAVDAFIKDNDSITRAIDGGLIKLYEPIDLLSIG